MTPGPLDGRGSRPGPARAALGRAHAHLTDSELVEAMRQRQPRSFEAFVDRFHRILLNYAWRAGFAEEECDEFVQELLDDVALELIGSGERPPENIRRYMIGAFRHRYFKHLRERERREHHVREAGFELAHERDAAGRPTAAAACSEYALREARGAEDEDARVAPVLRHLSALLDEGLSAEERHMLTWVSERIPQRQIAEWLGMDYALTRQRLSRLRERLSESAIEYGGRLPPREQRQLYEFLRRCGALPNDDRDVAG